MTDTATAVFTQTINGQPAANVEFFDVINPATEGLVGRAPECTDTQIDQAMAASVAAAASPWLRDPELVKESLVRAGDAIIGNIEELTGILVAEQGKPRHSAAEEIYGAAAFLQYYGAFDPVPHPLGDGVRTRGRVSTQPIGPTLGITAWNIPVLLASAKIGPAIRAGNPVIIKPSPFTPLTTLRIGELLRDVFPPGVLQILTGADTLGPKLTSRKEIRKISMTGSIATGAKVLRAGADDFKRVSLELGGNDAAILLDDFDVAGMSGHLFTAAFDNTGQKCICPKRVYVARSRMDDVAAGLTAEATKVVLGPGTTPGVTMGPLQNKAQHDTVLAFIEDAVAKGATVAIGGKGTDGPGYFIEPTILTNCRPGMRVVDEEQFGPVLPLIGFDHIDEAIEQANHTHFGLGGSVWGGDVERAEEVASRLYSGMVWVNCHGDGEYPAQPFLGVKSSGIGAELGQWGFSCASDLRVDYTTVDRV